MKYPRSALQVFLVAVAILTSGCATTIFTPYTGRITPVIEQLKADRKVDLSRCLVSGNKSIDSILYGMELGRIAQIQGDVDFSVKSYECAMQAIRAADEKATISATNALSHVSAILTNDNALPYRGEGYERVLLHNFQAMNYLFRNDIEGAGVEIRRANREQDEALRRHEEELEEARAEAEKNHFSSSEGAGRVYASYGAMDEIAGKVKNSFQNAYSFYVSGVVYELLKQPNDAYIDYKKALEIRPDNSYLQEDVMRLARVLGMDEELDKLKKAVDVPDATWNDDASSPGMETGELLLFFEEDFVPQKEEVKIPIPLPSGGIVAVAFPFYGQRWPDASPMWVMEGSDTIGVTEPLCDARALAVKALKEKVPAMVTRQIIRAVAKGIAAKKSKDKFGSLGELSSLLYNYISENADLRSWNTLPAEVQVMRASLPAGKHSLSLEQEGTAMFHDIEINIKSGAKTIVRVIRAGNTFKTTEITF